METFSWWLLVYGYVLVVVDFFIQRFRCFRLPKRLPLPSLYNMTVIVTGATSGIGLETSCELAKAGAHVVLAVRNTTAGKKLIEKWEKSQEATGGPSINAEVMELNLLSLASVRAFAKQWADRDLPIQVLINNAGIFSMGVKQKFSEDGYEHHIQANHLGHALLSLLLLPHLIRGAPSRIINVNSAMHHVGFANPEDLNLTRSKFSSVAAYSGSKIAQMLFSRVLQMKLPTYAGVDVIVVHPGEVTTNVTRDLPPLIQQLEKNFVSLFQLNPLEGARSVLYCATDKQVYDSARGLRKMGYPIALYFSSNCRPAKVAHRVNNMEYANKVWSKTLELVGLREEYMDQVLGNKIFSDEEDGDLKQT